MSIVPLDESSGVTRLLRIGLAKEIAVLKELSLAENKDRSLLVNGRTSKGYLSVDPAAVDSYFVLMEACLRSGLDCTLNVARWRAAFLQLDTEENHEITKCEQECWLYQWAKGEAEKVQGL